MNFSSRFFRGLIILVFVFSLSSVPASASTVNSCTAPTNGSCVIPINIDYAASVNGTVTVLGGSNDVAFTIYQPNGHTIGPATTVIQQTSFSFVSNMSGAFIFYFDNANKSAYQKDVVMSYSIRESPGGGGGIPDFPFQVAGVVILTVVIVATYLLARKSWKREN